MVALPRRGRAPLTFHDPATKFPPRGQPCNAKAGALERLDLSNATTDSSASSTSRHGKVRYGTAVQASHQVRLTEAPLGNAGGAGAPPARGREEADMRFHRIRLGDGSRIADGWLVISHGAVRAVLTPADDAGALLEFACDHRVRPCDGWRRFRGLGEAEAWLRARLEPPQDGTE